MSILEPAAAKNRRARLKRRRAALERVVEKALARLDRLDGDPDLEDGSDDEPDADPEPSLCGVTVGPGGQGWGPYVDLEEQCDDEGADHDGEPLLGWSEPTVSAVALPWGGQVATVSFDPLDQRRLSLGSDDREWECEDEGFDADHEPDSDVEPDRDGDGTPNPGWTIGGRDHWRVHGVLADVLLDPDETAGPSDLRAEAGTGGTL